MTDRAGGARTYDVAGPPAAPAIVLVHGTRLTRAMWARPGRDLGDTYRVRPVDLPGHGALADAVHPDAAADQWPRSSPHGRRTVGRSSSACRWAATSGCTSSAATRPVVRGLVLSGATPSRWPGGRCPIALWPGSSTPSAARRLDAPQRVVLPDPLPARDRRADRRRRLLVRRWRDRAARPGRRALLPAAGRLRGSDAAPQRRPRPALPARRGRLRAGGPDVRRVRLAGATHLANLDRPAAFTPPSGASPRSSPSRPDGARW